MLRRYVLIIICFGKFSPCFASTLVEFSAGSAMGTWTSNETFAVQGWVATAEGAYYIPVSSDTALTVGGFGKYTDASYTSDGIRKPTSWYQMGLSGGALWFLSKSVNMQLKGGVTPYSRYFISSRAESDVNNETRQTDSNAVYSGGVGVGAEVGLFANNFGEKQKERNQRYGISAGVQRQSFTQKSERTKITTNDVVTEDALERKAGTYTINLYFLAATIGVAF